MTKQEIFDLAMTRLLAQGEKAVDLEAESCAYTARNAAGKVLHCAVGLLLTPEERAELLAAGRNRASVYTLAKGALLPDRLLASDCDSPLVFLRHLQHAHDNANALTADSFTQGVIAGATRMVAAWNLDAKVLIDWQVSHG